MVLLSELKGGFSLRKKPLECEVSVDRNSEDAIVSNSRNESRTTDLLHNS
jgi:hypothetical protein